METNPELKTISLINYDEVDTKGSSLVAKLFVSAAPYNDGGQEESIIVNFARGGWVAYAPYQDDDETLGAFEDIAQELINESDKLDGSVGKLFNRVLKAVASPVTEGYSDEKWLSFEYVNVTDIPAEYVEPS